MKHDVDYRWHLAELMAPQGMHNSTDLIPDSLNAEYSCHDRTRHKFRGLLGLGQRGRGQLVPVRRWRHLRYQNYLACQRTLR